MFAEIYQYSDFKQRLLHFNQAFGSDPDYIFFARSVYEQQHLRSSINFVMRKWSCASLNNAISHAFGDAHISWKDFCILFSFYLKHSRKKDWKNFFDVIFLGTHTVQAVPKYIWMQHYQPRYEAPGDSRVKVAIKQWLTWGEWDYLLVSIPKLALGMPVTDKTKKFACCNTFSLPKWVTYFWEQGNSCA